ncbi:hypothetical protein VY88_26365 [Azospirillum thiophilum]|uniref:DUF3486 family protein n=1 Tax=Azospirillum thiophilum TaxID=528244 RepID=A0AAC8W4V9_9PROT|nr:DUF3486 family protein [Azospirillum thiophilum]ALG75059.1 hypothetical protein AL072_29275 [Azospirillum thiophilum]KJR62452.1 hypothetical protein VY88_26365 [Azospirillum thiophilum]
MARSTLDRLPKEIREELGRLREDGWTIDELLSKLQELRIAGRIDLDVSRSAVGRYVQTMDKVGERLRRSRAMAEGLVRQLGDEPDTRIARLNIEVCQTLIFDLINGEDGEGAKLDPEQVMFLTSSIQKLTSARKTDAELILRLQTEADKRAIAVMEATAKRKGLSADTIADIKKDFLGIRKAS